MDAGIHSTAQIFLTWIGFLLLEIHVKKTHMKGHREILLNNGSCYTVLLDVMRRNLFHTELLSTCTTSFVRNGRHFHPNFLSCHNLACVTTPMSLLSPPCDSLVLNTRISLYSFHVVVYCHDICNAASGMKANIRLSSLSSNQLFYCVILLLPCPNFIEDHPSQPKISINARAS